MKIDEKLVRHIADLARLELTSKEIKKFVPELKEVVEAFSLLKEVNTKGIQPSFHPVEIRNVLREDKVVKGISQQEALSLAQHKKNGYFMGPRILE